MNIKAIMAIAAFALASIAAPVMAADKPDLHLDLSAGYLSEANLIKNQTNVLQASARLSTDIRKVTIYGDYSASALNRSTSYTVPALAFAANTYDFGARFNFSPVTSISFETGTALNLNLDLPGQARTNKFIGVSAKTRVF